MCDRAPFVVAPLRAHVVQRTAIGHVHFHALVEPCRRRTVFQNGERRAAFHPHNVMQDRVGRGVAVMVDQADRF